MLGFAGSLIKGNSEKKAAQRQYENDIAARNEQREYDRGALDRLVEDAEGAGFNPLTVLRNGGTSYQNSGAPLLSRRETVSGVGDAIGGVGDFLANFDPFADQKREQEYRLVESQIASLNAGALSRAGRSSYASGDFEGRPSGRSGALSRASQLGKPTTPEVGDVKVTNPFQNLDVDPTVRDGSAFEERWGDWGGGIAGLGVMANDWLYNFRKRVSIPASKYAEGWIRDAYGQLSKPSTAKAKPKIKDNFNDPFPPWAW